MGGRKEGREEGSKEERKEARRGQTNPSFPQRTIKVW